MFLAPSIDIHTVPSDLSYVSYGMKPAASYNFDPVAVSQTSLHRVGHVRTLIDQIQPQ